MLIYSYSFTVLNKTVNYGVDARIKELHLRQADEVSTDLKKAEQEMSTILGKMEEMKKILESRDKGEQYININIWSI